MPSQNPDDLASAERYIRERSNAELTQIIAQPLGNALLDRLPGFTSSHLNTADATIIVELAEAEQKSREKEARRLDARKARRPAWLSLWVAVAVLVLGSGGEIAWSTIRSFATAAWSMIH